MNGLVWTSMKVLFALALTGCWTNAPIAAHADPVRAVIAGSFPVPARVLADPRLYDRLDHHAWITHLEHAWIRRDDPLPGHAGPDGRPKSFAVIDRQPDALRVVSDDDDARVAVWTALADVDLTIITPVELGTEDGARDPSHGVWLDPGVIIAPGASRPARRDRAIGLVDPELRATGFVRNDALGQVWVGPVPRAAESSSARQHIAAGASIRVGPASDARVLAEVVDGVQATATPAAAGWQEVDVRVRGIRVRGFVRTTETAPDDFGSLSTTGFGTYAITDTDRLMVDAGVCLFDRKGGEVIGVNTATRERYAFSVGEEWPSVFVGTPWDVATVTVHDLAPGSGTPRFETCAIKSR